MAWLLIQLFFYTVSLESIQEILPFDDARSA